MLTNTCCTNPDTANSTGSMIRPPEDSHGSPRPSECGPESLTHHTGLGTGVFDLGSPLRKWTIKARLLVKGGGKKTHPTKGRSDGAPGLSLPQGALHFLQSLLALFLAYTVSVKPECLRGSTILEFKPPSTFQNLNDRLTGDKCSSLSQGFEADYTLTEWMRNRAKCESGTFCP